MDLRAFVEGLPKDRRIVFLGDGLRVHALALRELLPEALIAPANLQDLHADAACVLAAARPETWIEARLLTPVYLRAPQAERERERRIRKGI